MFSSNMYTVNCNIKYLLIWPICVLLTAVQAKQLTPSGNSHHGISYNIFPILTSWWFGLTPGYCINSHTLLSYTNLISKPFVHEICVILMILIIVLKILYLHYTKPSMQHNYSERIILHSLLNNFSIYL